jgi:hypothetical protein
MYVIDMRRSKIKLSLIVIITCLILLSCKSSFTHTDITNQNIISSSYFPVIVFNYNSTYTKQIFTVELQLELDSFNILTLFFLTSGYKTNGEGIKVTFIIEQTEIIFTIEKLFQDNLNHNLTQLFSFPEAFAGKKNITVICEAQTSYFYQSGALQITSQTTIEKILPQILTETPSSLPIFPDWIRFRGSTVSTIRKGVTTIFNNSHDFDKLNFSLSFLANDFSAYKQYFEIEINNLIVNTKNFEENLQISESFLSDINSGLNLINFYFSVEMCIDEIQLSRIHLTINGINSQDILPDNVFDWYEWENNEFEHSFDLFALKPQVSYQEQIVEIQINYGCIGSLILPAIQYDIDVGTRTVDSGEIEENQQINCPQTITTKFSFSDTNEPFIFRIQGSAVGLGYFYILNTSFIIIEALPELQEQDILERRVSETVNHATPPSNPLVLSFIDFFKSTPNYHHFNISLSFSLTNEFESAIRQIHVLMKFDFRIIFDKQISFEKLIELQEQQALYSQVYKVTIILTLYGDGNKITLINLKYSLFSSSNSSDNPISFPENPASEPINPSKSLMLIEYGIILLFVTVLLTQHFQRKRIVDITTETFTQTEVGIMGVISKLLALPRKWWLKAKESMFRLYLLPSSICYIVWKTNTLYKIIAELNSIANNSFLQPQLTVLGKWGFYSFFLCSSASNLVLLSALYLTFVSTFYVDLFKFSKSLGVSTLFIHIPSSILVLLYIVSNSFKIKTFGIIILYVLFLNIIVTLILFGRTKNKQTETVKSSFFKVNVSRITNENESSNSLISEEENNPLDEQCHDFKQRIINYIINKITPEIQVSVYRFSEQFHISIELAHKLLIDVYNDVPNLGKYYIEEQTYIRSPDSEICNITLDTISQDKCGEFKSFADISSVKKSTTESQSKLVLENTEISFEDFLKLREIEQWGYIMNLYPYVKFFSYEDFRKFAEDSSKGMIDLKGDDKKIVSYFFELCNVNIERESKRFEIIKTLKAIILNGSKKENQIFFKEEKKGKIFLRIKCNTKYIEIGPYNKNDFMESGFIKTLDFILVDNVISILNTNILIGFYLNKDGTPNTSQPIYEMLHILLDFLSKNDYLKDLFSEKLKEIGIHSEDEFAKVYQQTDEDHIIKWSEALSSFKNRLVHSIVSDKYYLTSRFKEILQLSNEFIEAITLINCLECLKSYKIVKTFEIQNFVRSSIKNHILNTGNEFIRLKISEEGIVTDVKLSLEKETIFKNTDLLSRLFDNYKKWSQSITGADGFTNGKKHFFSTNEEGIIQRSHSIDTIIIVEDKMRGSLGNITPYLHTSNLVREKNMEQDKEDFEILRSLELTTYRFNRLESSQDDEIANITMDLPFGGTMGCRRVIETFQKMFSLYPLRENYFGKKEFFEILDKRSFELGLNLKFILQKLLLKKSILAFFQGEPCIKTDKEGLIRFGNKKIVSIRCETDTLANISKLRNINVFQYCTSFYVPEGIKLKNGTILGDGKKPLVFFNRFGVNESLSEYDIRISIYSGAKNREKNCIQITTSDNNLIFISPTIFFSKKVKKYYVLTNAGKALYADSYDQIKEEICFYFKGKGSDWIKRNNLELASIFIENDKSTYHNGELMQFDSKLDKEKIAIFCLLKLQDMLLNGVYDEKMQSYGINLFNSSLVSPERRTYHNYAPDISFYLSIFTTSTNTKLPLLKDKIENNYRIFSSNYFTNKDKKMLFLGCDYCNLDRNLELFIKNSENINKTGLFEQSEYERYRSFFDSEINFRTSGMVLHSSIQLIYFLNLYYGRITQEEIIRYVLPLSYNHRNRKTKINIEIQQNEHSKNKYDLSNLVEFLNTHESNNKITALGIYYKKKDIFVNIQDLLAYQSNKLQESSKINAINSLIELNKNKKISTNIVDGYINLLKGNRLLAPYLPVTIRYDEQEGYNYITLSKYNVNGLFRTLENSVNRRESSIFILADNYDARLIEILGVNRKELTTNKGIKRLYLRNPELKETLTLMYMQLNSKNYFESSLNIENFSNINYIRSFFDSYFNNYSGKRDKRTRLYNLNNYGGISINDQIITLLSLFAFKLYDCITNYGRYTHSLDHLNSKNSSSRDDPWIYRTSVNFENIARQEWNKLTTWYLNHEIYLDNDFNMNIISKYLEFNKILEESDPLVFNILTGFQLIFMNEESMPLVNFSDDLSIKHKVFKMQYDYTRAEIEKINITLFNRFNLLKYAFYDTLIRIWSSLMNIGTKKRKYYFQSIDNSVRKVLSSLTENDNSINDENANCIIDLEKARLLSYMTNTQLIQRQY